MATHTFNYTYSLDSISTMPLSMTDDTQIVKNVCVSVTAVDAADNTKTLTEKMYASLDGIYSYEVSGLPSDFIQVDDLTDAKAIEWWQATTTVDNLNIYFTWQIYGVAENDE
tara:strand:+ start:91 stop:426 length:336 start_codon:yes stop_codon:yes gene_type:complete